MLDVARHFFNLEEVKRHIDLVSYYKINHIKSNFPKDWKLPNIYLLHGSLSTEEMNKLYNHPKVKCFVSFTHGEGFGRPLLEASLSEKPVIAPNWSGHIDFIHPDYNILIGGELKNVHKSAANQFLLKESQWFNIYDNVASKAIYTYIQERLLLSSKNLDPTTAKRLLRNYVDDITLKELVNIF